MCRGGYAYDEANANDGLDSVFTIFKCLVMP